MSQKILTLLKENAPQVFSRYSGKRKVTLLNRLEDLRVKYRADTNPAHRRAFTQEANELKKELDTIREVEQNHESQDSDYPSA